MALGLLTSREGRLFTWMRSLREQNHKVERAPTRGYRCKKWKRGEGEEMDGARMVLKDAAPREKTRAEFRAGLSQNDRGSCFSRAALSLRLGGVWAKKKSQVPPSGARPSK